MKIDADKLPASIAKIYHHLLNQEQIQGWNLAEQLNSCPPQNLPGLMESFAQLALDWDLINHSQAQEFTAFFASTPLNNFEFDPIEAQSNQDLAEAAMLTCGVPLPSR